MNNKQTVIDMAMKLDSTIGQYIADAIIDHVSYDKIVKKMAHQGKGFPISRTQFYRKRKKLLKQIDEEKV